jgi:hypothetical protein
MVNLSRKKDIIQVIKAKPPLRKLAKLSSKNALHHEYMTVAAIVADDKRFHLALPCKNIAQPGEDLWLRAGCKPFNHDRLNSGAS